MDNTLIPFGKYKGQPIEAIKHDTQYLEWLQAQDWFRNSYPQINTLIVNNFNQPNDTPEHNTMVARFLDTEFTSKLLSIIDITFDNPSKIIDKSLYFKEHGYYFNTEVRVGNFVSNYEHSESFGNISFDVSFEDKKGSDIIIDGINIKYNIAEKFNFDFEANMKSFLKTKSDEIANRYKLEIINEMKVVSGFENITESCEVSIDNEAYSRGYYGDYGAVLIECKPTMSDEFPSVLRQCRDQGSHILVVGSYTGTGATLDQVRKMFGDIRILLLSDIEDLKL